MKDYEIKLEIPQGIDVLFQEKTVIVKKGALQIERTFDLPRISFEKEGNEIIIKYTKGNNRHSTILNSISKHIKNMILGLDKPFLYKLKVCSSHFPMTVSVKGDDFIVKNYYGERVPRTLKIPKDVKVKVTGDEIEVSSIYIEKAGNFASNIEKLAARSNYDNRIFQDGIYMINKKM